MRVQAPVCEAHRHLPEGCLHLISLSSALHSVMRPSERGLAVGTASTPQTQGSRASRDLRPSPGQVWTEALPSDPEIATRQVQAHSALQTRIRGKQSQSACLQGPHMGITNPELTARALPLQLALLSPANWLLELLVQFQHRPGCPRAWSSWAGVQGETHQKQHPFPFLASDSYSWGVNPGHLPLLPETSILPEAGLNLDQIGFELLPALNLGQSAVLKLDQSASFNLHQLGVLNLGQSGVLNLGQSAVLELDQSAGFNLGQSAALNFSQSVVLELDQSAALNLGQSAVSGLDPWQTHLALCRPI